MKIYIIGIICVLIMASFYYYNQGQEDFTNYNLIKNGAFTEGKDLSDNVTKQDNFSIIPLPNPENTEYVLKQSSFNNKGYSLDISVLEKTNYSLFYWIGTTKDYDGSKNSVLIKGLKENIKQNIKYGKKIELKTLTWTYIEHRFNSGNNKTINLDIGKESNFKKGYRVYTKFNLSPKIENLEDFKFVNGLKLFLTIDNNNNSKVLKSKVNNYDVKLNKEPKILDNMLHLDDIEGELPLCSTIIPEGQDNDLYSFVYTYKAQDFESGSLLRMDTVNDISYGIQIEINNNTGIDNKIIVTTGGIRNTYKVGLTNKIVNYFVIYNKGDVLLYVDGIKVQSSKKENLVPKRNLGTCPDGWTYSGNGMCVNKNNKNLGNCGNNISFKGSNDKNKLKWAKKCGVEWKNCAKLEVNSTAPNNNTSCRQSSHLHFANVPAKINKDKNLNGYFKNLLIYNRILSEDEISGINKYFIVKNSMLSVDNICNRPVMVRGSVDESVVESTNIDNECPFNNNEICNNNDCSCVNWDTMANVSDKCKNRINDYCRNNFNDPKCNKLRKNKCSINKEKPKPVVDNSKNYKLEFDLLKKQIEDLKKSQQNKKDCKDCDNKVDLSKYIRKDKIPCWGCKL